ADAMRQVGRRANPGPRRFSPTVSLPASAATMRRAQRARAPEIFLLQVRATCDMMGRVEMVAVRVGPQSPRSAGNVLRERASREGERVGAEAGCHDAGGV